MNCPSGSATDMSGCSVTISLFYQGRLGGSDHKPCLPGQVRRGQCQDVGFQWEIPFLMCLFSSLTKSMAALYSPHPPAPFPTKLSFQQVRRLWLPLTLFIN